MNRAPSVTLHGIFIWSIAILFYFYEFFLGVFPGTIADNLMRTLNVSAEKFSLIVTSYYVCYGFMQLPVGIIVNKFGTRKVLSLAAFLCAAGTFLFSMAQSIGLAIFSRCLMGFGASFAFVSLLVLALNWFPRKYFGFLTGIGQFLGSIGPLLAGGPLALLLEKFKSWQEIVFILGFIGLAISAAVLLFVKAKPDIPGRRIIYFTPSRSLGRELLELGKIKQVWVIVIYAALIYGSLPLLGAFWGTSFLQSKNLSKSLSAFIISMIWVGMAVGCPLLGYFSDKIKRRKSVLIFAAVLGLISSFSLLYLNLPVYLLFPAFFFIGIAGAGQSVTFANMAEIVPKKLQAASLGLNNCVLILFSSIIAPLASSIIQAFSRLQNGTFIYTEASFIKGFTLIPIIFSLALLVGLLWIQETFCRQQNEIHIIHRAKKESAFYKISTLS